MAERVVVGMSGGVDSFVTALLLKQRGYEVTGVKLDLWTEGESDELSELCRQLGVDFLHFDGRALFRQSVVVPFIRGYASGYTPNPCALCNCSVKWNLLLQAADRLGIESVATGHYVRIVRDGGHYYIHKGVDPNKDQSYFLWGLRQEVLSRALTPLGDYTKTEVKQYAELHGYEDMARKKESMGICFLEGSDYRDFLCRQGKEYGVEDTVGGLSGDILDTAGRVIGMHTGLSDYTVGQKRGLPLRDGQPLYVAEIRVADNTVIADTKPNLFCMQVEVEGVNAVCRDDLFAPDVELIIRGLGLNPSGFVNVEEQADSSLLVHLSAPAWAVAPGQPVAFYRGERLIGGGVVKNNG